ncbi:MAG: flagellar basal-body rod protein FlgG [Actinobacteria bacterium]|nr:flagellar basal-body rod protein FlgG [Actinomycetota bacterium]
MNSLYIASIGMNNQQLNIDVISNNLANINTPGYKRSEINFKDLYYQDIVVGKDKSIRVGLGSKVDGINRVFTQGTLNETGNVLDLAIDGEGFFRILLQDGGFGYTRDGSFRIDGEGNVVTVEGYKLEPPLNIDQAFSELTVSGDGTVSIMPYDSGEQVDVGRITLVRFTNPSGLASMSGNIYTETVASGAPQEDNGDGTAGNIRQGFIEGANINVIEEMVNMIVAQRAYEINSKAIKASDEMMGITNNIKQ